MDVLKEYKENDDLIKSLIQICIDVICGQIPKFHERIYKRTAHLIKILEDHDLVATTEQDIEIVSVKPKWLYRTENVYYFCKGIESGANCQLL
jgi:hypothetical protein